MVVLAIVLVTFFGAGIVFALNWIYSRSVRHVPSPASSADEDSRYEVGSYRR
jgi:hypothetical protein